MWCDFENYIARLYRLEIFSPYLPKRLLRHRERFHNDWIGMMQL